MSEYIVAVCYLIFSLFGILIMMGFKRRFPGNKFTPSVFLCYLFICLFFVITHLSIIKFGYNIIYLPANKWIEGNIIVRVMAVIFLLPQVFIGPSFRRDGK